MLAENTHEYHTERLATYSNLAMQAFLQVLKLLIVTIIVDRLHIMSVFACKQRIDACLEEPGSLADGERCGDSNARPEQISAHVLSLIFLLLLLT
jgi:hypothetical protein